MTEAMAKALLRKHLIGDVGEHRWPPIAKLIKLGYLADEPPYLVVTPKGRAWCDAHHMEYAI